MKIKATFGPLPSDFRFAVGEPLREIGTGLRSVTISQGASGRDFLPHVVAELAMVAAEVEGTAEIDVVLPPNAHDALVALGWTPPPGEPIRHIVVADPLKLTEAADRISDIVQAAYAYVETPEGLIFDPEVEDEDPAYVAYQHLVGCVERHRNLYGEMTG
jgi:hypothetical protein